MMRKLSSQKKFFSFSHATYNRDTQVSDGIRMVKKALLRPQASSDQVANSDNKLFYWDEDICENRVCWQPLIMSFNGIRVRLS